MGTRVVSALIATVGYSLVLFLVASGDGSENPFLSGAALRPGMAASLLPLAFFCGHRVLVIIVWDLHRDLDGEILEEFEDCKGKTWYSPTP